MKRRPDYTGQNPNFRGVGKLRCMNCDRPYRDHRISVGCNFPPRQTTVEDRGKRAVPNGYGR